HRHRCRRLGSRPCAQRGRLADLDREALDRGCGRPAVVAPMIRRHFLGGTLASSLLAGKAAFGQTRDGEFLIRGAYVLTMDEALGDMPNGDVHIRDGAIVAVGRALQAPPATVIDGTGMVVMPGIVDTHWHMWNSLLCGLVGGTPQNGYFPMV